MSVTSAPTVIARHQAAHARVGSTTISPKSGLSSPPVEDRSTGPWDPARQYLILVPRHRYVSFTPVVLDGSRCVIGSAPDCQLRIAVQGVADHHAVILSGKNRALLTAWDHRTWVTDLPVRETELRAGDRLAFGPVELIVRYATPEELVQYVPGQHATGATACDALQVAPPILPATQRKPGLESGGSTVAPAPDRAVPRTTGGPNVATNVCHLEAADESRPTQNLAHSVQRAVAEGILPASASDVFRTLPNNPEKMSRVEVPAGGSQTSRRDEQELTSRTQQLVAREQALEQREAEWSSRIEQSGRERDEALARIALLSENLAERTRQIEQAGRQLEDRANELDRLAAEASANERRLAEQSVKLAAATESLNQRDTAVRNLQSSVENAFHELTGRIEQVQQQERDAESRRGELDEQFAQLDERDRTLSNREQAAESLADAWRSDVQTQQEALVAERQRLEEDSNRVEQERAAVAARSGELDGREQQLSVQWGDLTRREHDVAEQRDAVAAARQSGQLEWQERTTALTTRQRELDERAAELDRRQVELQQAESRLGDREQELQLSLTTLSQQLTDVADQRREAEAVLHELADRSAAVTRLEEQLAGQRLELERAEQELARTRDDWSDWSDAANRELVAARQQIDADRQQLETDRQRLAAEQAELAQGTQQLAERQQALEATERERSVSRDAWVAQVAAERRLLETERQQIGLERGELATDRNQLESTRQGLDVEWQRIAQAVAEGACREQELNARRQAAEQAERDLARLREEWSNEASRTQDDIESRRQGLADASRRLTERQVELDQLQTELKERERLADEQKIQASEIARAVETRLAELTARQQDLDTRETEFARKSEQLTVQEHDLRRIERELDARKDDWQQGFDVERQAVSSRSIELTAQQQRLESRRQEVEALEQALQERESSLRCEIEAERRGLERDRQEFDEKLRASASIPHQVQPDHEAVQRQAEELVRRQADCREQEESLQLLVKLLDEQRIQIDHDTETVQGEHARLREELTRLEAERLSLHTEQQRLWAERERLEATAPQHTAEREALTAERARLDSELSRLQAEREAFAAERTTFEGEVRAWAEVFHEGQQLQAQPTEVPPVAETLPIGSAAKTDTDCSTPAFDVQSTPGPSFDNLSENDGWMLDELLGVGLGGATRPPTDDAGVAIDDQQETQGRDEIVVDQLPAETENDADTAEVTQDVQVSSPGDANMHLYIHDLLARLRSDSEATAPLDVQQEWAGTASPSGLLSLDEVLPGLAPPTSDMEEKILADIDDLGQSVRKSVEQVARPRQDPNEIRLGLGTLRDLANYSARTAIAQHSWKKRSRNWG